ncbi:hypothetical protein HDE_06052 [Halotydeus destructor]|nr:hypothetical protein HDE_06052 [Halotydeus destructor]
MKGLLLITVLITIKLSVADPTSAGEQLVSLDDNAFTELCSSANRSQLVEQSDQCIVDSSIRSTLSACRLEVYNFTDVVNATEAFCAGDNATRIEFKGKFENCTKDKGITPEKMIEEWEINCGFCKNKDVLVKTDDCLSDPIVKEAWLACRQSVSGTRDPLEAANKFCSLDKDGKLKNDELFYKCLADNQVTKESWLAATQSCSQEEGFW